MKEQISLCSITGDSTYNLITSGDLNISTFLNLNLDQCIGKFKLRFNWELHIDHLNDSVIFYAYN